MRPSAPTREGGGSWGTMGSPTMYGARMKELARRRLFDVVIVLGTVGGAIEILVTHGDEEGPKGSLWLLFAGLPLLTLPLLARRQFPFGAPAFVAVAAASLSFAEGEFVPYLFTTFLPIVTATFLFGLIRDRRQALSGLAIVFAAALVVIRNDPRGDLPDAVFVLATVTCAFLAAFALSRKLEQMEEAEERARLLDLRRLEEAQQAVEEERRRIARELHDVVAHSVSVMTVQAGGVRRLLREDQEREREALKTIEETGRQALAEMRRMLGMLRSANEQPDAPRAPQPGMTSIASLIGQVRDAGLPVEFRVKGEPAALPPGIDLSAYRIVQEALTNALKHAGPARAKVEVRWSRDAVELEITDDGRSDEVGVADGGHGLAGMQERVALFGGKVEGGPRIGGGYVVRARLPVREEQVEEANTA
jgi:signal transduction histidine kinase